MKNSLFFAAKIKNVTNKLTFISLNSLFILLVFPFHPAENNIWQPACRRDLKLATKSNWKQFKECLIIIISFGFKQQLNPAENECPVGEIKTWYFFANFHFYTSFFF